MKSVFIALYALSATALMMAQISTIQKPRRVLQALAPIFQANVSALATIAGTQATLTATAALNAGIVSAYASANATLLASSQALSSTAVNQTNVLQGTLTLATSALYTAQQNLIIAQAALSNQLAQEQMYDNLYAQVLAATVLVNGLTISTSAAQNSLAQAAFLQLLPNVNFQITLATALIANATVISVPAQVAFNLPTSCGIFQFVAQNTIAIASLAASTASKTAFSVTTSSNTPLALINLANTNIATFIGAVNAGNLASAQTTANQCLTAFANLALNSDNAYNAAYLAFTTAQNAVNVAFYFFNLAQTTIVAQEIASVAASNLTTIQVSALITAQGQNAINSALSSNATIALNNGVMAAAVQANLVTQQNAYRFMLTNLLIAQITANQATITASFNAKGTQAANAQKAINLAVNKFNLGKAQAQLAFYLLN